MKRQLRPYLYSIIILFCLLFLFSVIFSALYAGSVINKNVYDILLLICGYLPFLCGGLCFGFFIEKKALFQARFVSLLLAGASFLIGENIRWIHLCAHSLLWLAASMIVFSLRPH
ncbi:MAG: hypothetical protein UEK58_02630 [Merdibacter sp.]|nr:hypothetical protein [Merdibacter sp.]